MRDIYDRSQELTAGLISADEGICLIPCKLQACDSYIGLTVEGRGEKKATKLFRNIILGNPKGFLSLALNETDPTCCLPPAVGCHCTK